MYRWMIFLSALLILIYLYQVSTETCLHNEGQRCTGVRHTHDVSAEENDRCHHSCIRTGHATGHCSVSSNCFQFCLCQEKDL